MPIYEYVCPACQHEFEELARQVDAPAGPCPACGHAGAERKLSVFAPRQAAASPAPGPCGMPGTGACGSCCGGGGMCPLPE